MTRTIRDPSGAVIASASVQLTNKGTSAQRSATTGSSGFFNLVNVERATMKSRSRPPVFSARSSATWR